MKSGFNPEMRPLGSETRTLAAGLLCVLLIAAHGPAALAQSAGGVVAAPQPSIPPPQIIVVAPRPKTAPPSPHALARQFIDTHIGVAYSGQLARWTQDVCPTTDGLTPAYDDFVTARILAVAAEIGAPSSVKRSCTPNIEVVFTPTPQSFVDLMAKKQLEVLGFHYRTNVKALETFNRDVKAWYVTATRGGVEEYMDAPQGPVPGGCAGSYFTHCLSSLFYNVLIVVDTKAVAGAEIGPVSDYVSMLALSQVKPRDACSTMPSILDLLAKDCADQSKPETLTPFDLAFLKGLYKANLKEEVWLEKSAIGDAMVRLTKPAIPPK